MIIWLTTQASGRAHTHGADDGVTGWKLHAVECPSENMSFPEIKHYRALCGLSPRMGWGLDLFIEDKCSRCLMAVELHILSDNELHHARWSVEHSMDDAIQSRRGQKQAAKFLGRIIQEQEKRKLRKK